MANAGGLEMIANAGLLAVSRPNRFETDVTATDKDKGKYHVKIVDHGRDAGTRTVKNGKNAGSLQSVKAVAPSVKEYDVTLTKVMLDKVLAAIPQLVKPYVKDGETITPKGCLSGQSGLAAAFEETFKVPFIPVQAIMAQAGLIVARPVFGDVMLYLAKDAPTSGRDPQAVAKAKALLA